MGEAGGCANKRPLSFRFSAARQNAGIGVGLSTRNQLISRIKRRIIRTLDRLRERERAREREREKKRAASSRRFAGPLNEINVQWKGGSVIIRPHPDVSLFSFFHFLFTSSGRMF